MSFKERDAEGDVLRGAMTPEVEQLRERLVVCTCWMT
jgi:hypothetical protein